MKYIITKDNDVIIFSDGISHRDMARDIGCVEIKKDIVGAGFVRFQADPIYKKTDSVESVSAETTVCCYGESVSLDIRSRGDIDGSIIERVNKGY